MVQQIEAVIFDMGGVILRSDDLTPREKLAQRFGLSREQLEELVFYNDSAALATIGKIDEKDHWKVVCNTLKVSEEERTDFEAAFWQGDRLDNTLINFLRSLRPQYKTGLLSNAWTGTRDTLLRIQACMDAFDVSIFSYEVGLAKPDAAIYREILKRLGVEAPAAIFLDDNLSNVESAAALGMHAIRFLNQQQAIQDIRALL